MRDSVAGPHEFPRNRPHRIPSIVVRYRAGGCCPIRLQNEIKAGANGALGQVERDRPVWQVAARAAEAKKARDIRVLDLRGMASFADFFVLCTGASPPQIQAISEEIGRQLRDAG
ncbi:MAG: RsfS/YbeB/iojap family protein, partial [Bryobacteraceae bacterium]